MRIPLRPVLLFVGLLAIIGAVSLVVESYRNDLSCQTTSNPFPTQDPKGNYLFHENLSIGNVCTFSGQATRGQAYSQDITQGLVLCLTPDNFWQKDGGWRINVSDKIGEPCDDNFAGIATPPFRGGDNATFIQGWQFRNDNNTATAVTAENHAHLYTRDFNFVFNVRDYQELFDSEFNLPAINTVDVTKIKSSRGSLTITDIKLGNLIPNERPWIESMKFEVKIYLPPD